MLLAAIRRALAKYGLIPFAVTLPFIFAYLLAENTVHWVYALCLLGTAFAGVLVIGVPIEYRAAKKGHGNQF